MLTEEDCVRVETKIVERSRVSGRHLLHASTYANDFEDGLAMHLIAGGGVALHCDTFLTAADRRVSTIDSIQTDLLSDHAAPSGAPIHCEVWRRVITKGGVQFLFFSPLKVSRIRQLLSEIHAEWVSVTAMLWPKRAVQSFGPPACSHSCATF